MVTVELIFLFLVFECYVTRKERDLRYSTGSNYTRSGTGNDMGEEKYKIQETNREPHDTYVHDHSWQVLYLDLKVRIIAHRSGCAPPHFNSNRFSMLCPEICPRRLRSTRFLLANS